MNVEDLIDYCSKQENCYSCEYRCACDIHYDIYIPCCFDIYRKRMVEGKYNNCIIKEWYNNVDWNTEIRKDAE